MTVERLELLAWAAGVSPQHSDDWTWGELINAVEGYQERQRQERQAQAQLLYGHAIMINRSFAGSKEEMNLWDFFPVFTDDEIREMRVAQVKRKMQKI